MYKYIFGPVPSRRLGVSLGIDIIPYKTCSLDCVYCECGKTTNLIDDRRSFFDCEDVIEEINNYLKKGVYLDYITFAGSGEPVLNKDIGKISREIKKMTTTPLALLTNGTLFFDKQTREDVKEFDLIMPSLDASDEATFKKINKPNKNLDYEKIVDGLINLRKEYSGEIDLELFIIEGLNDNKKQLNDFSNLINRIKPDKVMLNSLDRPPVEEWVKPVSATQLEKIKNYLNFKNVEIIKKYKRKEIGSQYEDEIESKIINIIKVRPCTIEDIVEITGIRKVEVSKYLDILENEKRVQNVIGERGTFFKYIY